MHINIPIFTLQQNTMYYLSYFLSPNSQTRFLIASRSLHICIVGSGPSGFYAAKKLLSQTVKKQVHNRIMRVDMIEKLATPFGLVRFGVAPDHSNTKNVINDFEKVADHPYFRFFGNIELDKQVSVKQLLYAYDKVILACGAASEKTLGLPNENAGNVFSARSFVNWYNGHPDYVNKHPNLNVTNVAVIGHGNVSIDVSRLLCSSRAELADTDITDTALQAIDQSSIQHVYMIGRRGVNQSEFSNKELRELVQKKSFPVFIRANDLRISYCENTFRNIKRRVEILQTAEPDNEYNNKTSKDNAVQYIEGEKSVHFRYFRRVKQINTNRENNVQSIVTEITKLNKKNLAIGTGKFERIDVGLLLMSLGYRSKPIKNVPFDEELGIIPNSAGQVFNERGEVIENLFVVGWIKRGSKGIIGTNLTDAKETIDTLLTSMGCDPKRSDIRRSKEYFGEDDCEQIRSDVYERINMLWKDIINRGARIVTMSAWRKIDEEEKRRGAQCGKPRVKIVCVKEQLQVALQ